MLEGRDSDDVYYKRFQNEFYYLFLNIKEKLVSDDNVLIGYVAETLSVIVPTLTTQFWAHVADE